MFYCLIGEKSLFSMKLMLIQGKKGRKRQVKNGIRKHFSWFLSSIHMTKIFREKYTTTGLVCVTYKRIQYLFLKYQLLNWEIKFLIPESSDKMRRIIYRSERHNSKSLELNIFKRYISHQSYNYLQVSNLPNFLLT